jgi:hypothetical protein
VVRRHLIFGAKKRSPRGFARAGVSGLELAKANAAD